LRHLLQVAQQIIVQPHAGFISTDSDMAYLRTIFRQLILRSLGVLSWYRRRQMRAHANARQQVTSTHGHACAYCNPDGCPSAVWHKASYTFSMRSCITQFTAMPDPTRRAHRGASLAVRELAKAGPATPPCSVTRSRAPSRTTFHETHSHQRHAGRRAARGHRRRAETA